MNQKGLSLIELMLAAVISVVMIQGLLQMFFSNLLVANYNENQALARERAQNAIYLLSRDVREAGTGAGLIGPGSYVLFYNERFAGATDSNGIAGLTLDQCQWRCDTAGQCPGFSWASEYVINGLADFTPSMSLDCLNTFGSGGTVNPVDGVMQPLLVAIGRLEQQKANFDSRMSSPPTVDELNRSNRIDALRQDFQQEHDRLRNRFTTDYNRNNAAFDATAATADVEAFMVSRQNDLNALGLDIGGDDNVTTGGHCINSTQAGAGAVKTGSCWIETGTGTPARVAKGGWISYQYMPNTLFYTGACAGVSCTANGSSNNSDAMAIVLDPQNNEDCTGNPVADGALSVNRYFIQADASGNRGLYCQGFNPANGAAHGAAQLMVDGIENMQVLYGYADNGGHGVTSYREPGDISNWMYVRSVQIGILAGGENLWGPTARQQRSYSFMGVNNLQITDRRQRFVFTTVQRLYATRDDYSWRERLVYKEE